MRIAIVRLFMIFLTVGAAATLTPAQTSPYAGQQRRDIKALSPEEIDAELRGDGKGEGHQRHDHRKHGGR